MQPSSTLHDSLLASGWTKIRASENGAYERAGDRYLTWVLGGVTIATSGTSKFYDAGRAVVLNCMGSGYEVTVEALLTNPEARGRGAARAALGAWMALAKAAGVTLYIEPVPQEESVDRQRLIGLYESVGFLPCDDGCHVLASEKQHGQ